MAKYSIGFRMKFDNIEPEDMVKVISNFLQKFDRYEIKITKNIVSYGKIFKLLKVSEELASSRYSLHLPKDILCNTQSFVETKKIINMLQHHKSASKIYLVTHIPYGCFHEYLKFISDISTELPENYILLLENECMDTNNYNYLKQINELCAFLCHKQILNVGICLDIGHLLYGFHMEGLTQDYCIMQLKNMSYIISLIKQFHIHDYSYTDHLQLGSGIMNLELVSRFIVQNKLLVPIIIEATIKEPEKEGMQQIILLSTKLKAVKGDG